MKYLIFLFLPLLPNNTLAQNFTFDQLVKLYEGDKSYFDTEAIKQGYLLSAIDETGYTYTNKDGTLFSSISLKFDYSNSKKTKYVQWVFKSDSNYLSIKKQLAAKGYVVISDTTTFFSDGSRLTFLYGSLSKTFFIELTDFKPKIYTRPVYYFTINKLGD